MAYKYTVVSYIPDLIAGERINIGIILHDMDSKVVLKKFTKNIDELNRRYAFGHKGVEFMQSLILKGFDELPEIEQDKNYLLKEHEKERGPYNRILYGEPMPGVLHTEGCHAELEDVLEHLYDMFIIIDKKEKKNG